jgi:hypothetical protein
MMPPARQQLLALIHRRSLIRRQDPPEPNSAEKRPQLIVEGLPLQRWGLVLVEQGKLRRIIFCAECDPRADMLPAFPHLEGG